MDVASKESIGHAGTSTVLTLLLLQCLCAVPCTLFLLHIAYSVQCTARSAHSNRSACSTQHTSCLLQDALSELEEQKNAELRAQLAQAGRGLKRWMEEREKEVNYHPFPPGCLLCCETGD